MDRVNCRPHIGPLSVERLQELLSSNIEGFCTAWVQARQPTNASEWLSNLKKPETPLSRPVSEVTLKDLPPSARIQLNLCSAMQALLEQVDEPTLFKPRYDDLAQQALQEAVKLHEPKDSDERLQIKAAALQGLDNLWNKVAAEQKATSNSR